MGKGKALDFETKEKIKALLATGKSKNYVANAVKCSWSTVEKVSKECDNLEEIREQKKRDFISVAWEQIYLALQVGNQKLKLASFAQSEYDQLMERLSRLLKQRERNRGEIEEIRWITESLSKLASIPLKDISVYFGTLFDKQALAKEAADNEPLPTGNDPLIQSLNDTAKEVFADEKE